MKLKLADISHDIQKFLIRRSPEILIGLGITGMISSTILAVKATPKALYLLEDRRVEGDKEELTILETVETVWSCYIPSVALTAVSTVCIIYGNSVNMQRNAALVTAYSLSETALKSYQEKVVDTIGEKKEKIIRDEVAQDKLSKTTIQNVILTEKGNTNCYDAISGRYFKSDKEFIVRTINKLNQKMLFDGYSGYISINDLYYELGLDNIKLGDRLGWNMDRGLIEVTFSSLLDSNGIPCLVMDFTVQPQDF